MERFLRPALGERSDVVNVNRDPGEKRRNFALDLLNTLVDFRCLLWAPGVSGVGFCSRREEFLSVWHATKAVFPHGCVWLLRWLGPGG